MILEIADRDIIFFFGLLIFWIGGMSVISIGSVPTFGYNLEKGYDYICSECGKPIPKNHYHDEEECLDCSEWNKRGLPCQPDHRCYYGVKEYVKEPPWKNNSLHRKVIEE